MRKTYPNGGLRMKLLHSLLLLFVLTSHYLLAQPVLVKDINPGAVSSGISSIIKMNDMLYFAATTAEQGREFWKSDGTPEGTALVKDINPGPRSSNPSEFIIVGNTLYFVADDGYGKAELWKSDGTPAGTLRVQVKDINLAGNSTITQLTDVAGTLYFTANDGRGIELWKSDGTPGSTVMVKDINSGLGSSNPAYLTAVGSMLYFVADDGVNGIELWKSDGTEAGTQLVKDIWSGSSGSSPAYLTSLNGTLLFAATNGAYGRELWKSDGTETGTVLVKDITPGASSSSPYNLAVNYNNKLSFFIQLNTGALAYWVSDGTEDGTNLATTYYPPRPGPVVSVSPVKVVDGRAFMVKTIYSPSFGLEVSLLGGSLQFSQYYTRNPTVDITTQVAVVDGTVYASANDGVHGYEIWQASGNQKRISDISPGSGSSYPTALTSLNGKLYFAADNGVTGSELWVYDPVNCIEVGSADLTVTGSTVCFGQDATVTVSQAEAGVKYRVYNSTQLVAEAEGQGADLVFTIPAGKLPKYGFYATVKAVGCTETALTQRASVNVLETSSPPVSYDRTIYSGQQTRLYVNQTQSDVTYRWYTQATGGEVIATDDYTIPSLYATTSYYVSAYNAQCGESPRKHIVVNVIPPPAITSFSPGEIVPPGEVTVKGAGFTAVYVDAVKVKVGDDVVTSTVLNDSTLTIKVPEGTNSGRITVTSPAGTATSAASLSTAGSLSIRINAGGAAFTTREGKLFLADTYASRGNVYADSNLTIFAYNETLYRSERWGEFSYNIPVSNGTYQVVLHFAEIYFGATFRGQPVSGGVGSRKFNVDIEGDRKLTEFDIYAEASGALRDVQKTYQVNVSDGVLNLDFLKGSANFPKISAIEVIRINKGRQINTGGAAYLTGRGVQFSEDKLYNGGNTGKTTGEVANTGDDELYRSERWGEFSYDLPVSSGSYTVTLHFAEIYFGTTFQGEAISGGAGSRKFDVDIEGERKLTEYDIYAKAGGAMKAVQESFTVTVSDDTLNLNFRKGSANFPKISAIEVVPASSAARIAATGSSPENRESFQANLYPNPVEDYCEVKLSIPVSQVKSTAVTSASGRVMLLNTHRPGDENTIRLEVSSLKTGLYLLKVDTQSGTQVIKLVKQ